MKSANHINLIKKIKVDHQLNSAQLAEKLGVSHRTVEDWLAGQKPSKTALLLIKNIFSDDKR